MTQPDLPTGPGYDSAVAVGPGMFGINTSPYLVSCVRCGAALLITGSDADEPTILIHSKWHEDNDTKGTQ